MSASESTPRRARTLLAGAGRPGVARTAIWVVVIALCAWLIPQVASSSYSLLVVSLSAIYVLVTAGLNIAIGFTGQFQMAQAAMMAIGAYASSILTLQHGIPFWFGALIATGLGLVMGLAVALVALRTSSHYLLLATFGLQVIATDVISKLSITGGVNGTTAPVTIPFFGSDLSPTGSGYVVLLLVIAGVGLAVADWLRYSYLGLGMNASRQHERLVRTAGMDPRGFKVVAILLSAVYAAIGGVLIGPILGFLVADSFALQLALLLLLMVVVGGAGSVIGVAVAAVALTILSEAAQGATVAWPLVYGTAIMAILVIAPGGIAGLTLQLRDLVLRRWRTRGGRRPATSAPAPGAAAPLVAPSAPDHAAGASRPLAVVGGDSVEPLLQLADVRRYYGGVKAVDGVAMAVQPGTIHGLIGPNGSGKTTLFDVISGFSRPNGGSIALAGTDVSAATVERRADLGLGRTFQHPSVLADNTVLESVFVGVMHQTGALERLRPLRRTISAAHERRAWDALCRVGLEELHDAPVRDLAYGQQRLVDLARVLAGSPRLVLLDEPGAGISGSDRETLREIMLSLRQDGTTIVVIEHDMRLMMGICDRITVLNAGRVIADATPAEVSSDLAVVEAYLGKPIEDEATRA